MSYKVEALQRVVAFDLDNTLLDPTGEAYEQTVAEFLSHVPTGMPPDESVARFEEVRALGHAMERNGLQNPIHERAHPDGLAVFLLLFCADESAQKELGITPSNQPADRAFMAELLEIDRAIRRGPLDDRLEAEKRLWKLSAADNRSWEFFANVRRIAREPRVQELCERYCKIKARAPIPLLAPLMKKLRGRGFAPVVITEGRDDVQREKLERLGLDEVFGGRVLISETAGLVDEDFALDKAIAELLSSWVKGSDVDDERLRMLWAYRCVIDEWSHKSSWFFARCLHALRSCVECPDGALMMHRVMARDMWDFEPLRFVMVGDRYDTDVAPVIDLLGKGRAFTVRLRAGKYGREHPEDGLPEERRPDHTFTDFDSLATFLTDDLDFADVPAVTTAPPLAPADWLTDDYLEQGARDPIAAVRKVAKMITEVGQ